MLSYRVTNVAFEDRSRVCELDGNGAEEFASVTKITSTSGKEETSSKTLLTVISARDRTSDGRLAGAGHTIQPKHALAERTIAPIDELVQKIYSGAGEALWVMLA